MAEFIRLLDSDAVSMNRAKEATLEPQASLSTATAAARAQVARPRTYSPALWGLALAVAWLVSGLYVFHVIDRNWIPHDEGVLGQSAARVLLGEMPHRDFAEIYTGGLSYFHALALRTLGVNLLSLRYAMLAVFLVWIPALFYCASRLVSPLGALGLTLLSVVWTLPNYPAAMPSWYNLFFATFGVACLLCHAESGHWQWLFLAGLMGGLSVLVKITGLYFVAAGWLYLVVREAGSATGFGGTPAGGDRAYRWFVGIGLTAFVGALVSLVANAPTPRRLYHFVLPGAALAGVAWDAVARSGEGSARVRFGRLAAVTLPFCAGLALPLLLFVVPYAATGSLGPLVRGVFLSPTTRLALASMPPAGIIAAIPVLVLALLLAVAMRAPKGAGWLASSAVIVVVAGLVIGAGPGYLYWIGWFAFAQCIPVLLVLGAVALLRHQRRFTDAQLSSQQCFLLLAAAGLCSLIEFPYAAPIYFCYTAPLTMLAIVAAARLGGVFRHPLPAVIGGLYLAFAVGWLNTGSLRNFGLKLAPAEQLDSLEMPSGGLRVAADEARAYNGIVRTVVAHAKGEYIYAAPDAPEVYFLTGLRNPTRVMFDFLEPADRLSGVVLDRLAEHGVAVVAINTDPKFSGPLPSDLARALEARYPRWLRIGKFIVRWRE